MQPFIWDRRPDGLRAPAMVCAFQGWNDAGDAASSAVSFLAESLDARRFAKIGGQSAQLSISHTDTLAFAQAVILG